jgi:hypothetical protein
MLLAGALALTFGAGTASAQDTIDPSTLHVSSPLSGTTSDPVQLGATNTVSVTNVSNGADNLNVPWLLIVGIPNWQSATPPNITSSSPAFPSYPLATNGTTASMGSTQEAYSQLGLDPGTNNSNSFTNWADAETKLNHMSTTSFTLYEYNIPVTLAGGGTDTFTFASNLPQGTFVIAYGETTSTKNGKTTTTIYDTPFTEAGLTDTQVVPEPSTLALAGLGALGFVGYGLRRRLKK